MITLSSFHYKIKYDFMIFYFQAFMAGSFTVWLDFCWAWWLSVKTFPWPWSRASIRSSVIGSSDGSGIWLTSFQSWQLSLESALVLDLERVNWIPDSTQSIRTFPLMTSPFKSAPSGSLLSLQPCNSCLCWS